MSLFGEPLNTGGGGLNANVSERATLQPSLAISTVIFALKPDANGKVSIWMPLVRRTREPFKGQWALPGGPLHSDESLEDAARRNLQETTGIEPAYLEQLYAFGGLQRSHKKEIGAQRVVSIVYWALVKGDTTEFEERHNVQWHPADAQGSLNGEAATQGSPLDLAFDHREIVDYALWRLRNKIEYSQVGYHFLGELFTLAQLREVHEAVLNKTLDKANFRRDILANKDLEETEHFLEGGRHRPPKLYRYTGPRGLGSPSRSTS
ncbi:NUDIX hydrolase [Neomicrococcus lactis]